VLQIIFMLISYVLTKMFRRAFAGEIADENKKGTLYERDRKDSIFYQEQITYIPFYIAVAILLLDHTLRNDPMFNRFTLFENTYKAVLFCVFVFAGCTMEIIERGIRKRRKG
jgi:hypothetical protein